MRRGFEILRTQCDRRELGKMNVRVRLQHLTVTVTDAETRVLQTMTLSTIIQSIINTAGLELLSREAHATQLHSVSHMLVHILYRNG